MTIFTKIPPAPKPNGDPRVSPVPSARRCKPLRSRQRPLLPPLFTGAAHRATLTARLLRMPQRTETAARQPDVRRRQ